MKIEKKIDLISYICLFVVFGVALIILDQNSFSYNYLITIIECSLIYAVVALSMNLVTGFTGLFSLGQAGFMAIGAYITAIFTIPPSVRDNVYYVSGIADFLKNICLPIPVAIIIGGLVAGLFAVLIGIPVLKLKSDYLAIATLGFAEIIRAIIASPNLNKITNGSFGLNSVPGFKGSFECFIYCAICIVLMILIINSSYGRDFKAIREDEIAAQAVGINLFRTKQLSFVISSFFAGIGGGLLAMYMRSIDSRTFSIVLTYDILLIVVLGGIGSITGSIIGSFFVNIGKEVLRFFDEPLVINGVEVSKIGQFQIFKTGFRMVIFALLLMIVVLFFRKGLIGGKEFSPSGIYKFFKKRFVGGGKA